MSKLFSNDIDEGTEWTYSGGNIDYEQLKKEVKAKAKAKAKKFERISISQDLKVREDQLWKQNNNISF